MDTQVSESQMRERARALARYHANKDTIKLQKVDYYQKNKEAFKARAKAYKQAHPEKALDWRLRSTYGVTLDQYRKMEVDQGGVCAICKKPPTEREKRLSLDHNHRTNAVRALLCRSCNTMLGVAKEDPEILKKAVDYLARYA